MLGGLENVALDAQALENDRGVDEVDPVATDPAQVASLDGARDGIRIQIDELAPIGDAQGGDLRTGDLLDQSTQLGAQVDIRPQNLDRRSVDGRHVDGVTDDAAAQHIGDLFGDFDADRFLRLRGGSAKVRRQDHVRKRPQLAVLGQRLVLEHIEPGGRDLARLDRLDERALLDDPAAGAVEDPQTLLRLGERRLVDHVVGIIRQRHVDGDVVRLGQKLIERRGLHLHRLGPARRKIWIVGQHAHPEGLRTLRDLAANATEADDTKRLLEEFDPAETLAIPLTGLHRGCRLRNGPRAAEQVRERQLGRCDRVARRRIHHDHPAFRRGIDIHVVDPHAGPAHHAQQRGRGDHVGGDLRLRTDGDRVDIAH